MRKWVEILVETSKIVCAEKILKRNTVAYGAIMIESMKNSGFKLLWCLVYVLNNVASDACREKKN